MEYEWNGLIVGDADAAGRIIGKSGATYQAYTRRDFDAIPSAPKAITTDPNTGLSMYPLRRADEDAHGDVLTVEEWQAMRPGRGRWGRGISRPKVQ